MLKYLIVFSLGLISSMLVLLIFRSLSLRHRILNLRGVPLVGGLGVFISFSLAVLIGVYIFKIIPNQLLVIFSAASLILLSGVVDDLREMSVLQKFLVQTFCAIILITFDVKTHIVYLGFWGNIAVTFLWILGITNAFNLLDIMDGLVCGVSIIAAISFFVISFFIPDLSIQILSLALCAVNLGFLIFNFPPAKIYLGNSGSHFLGFFIAAIALISRYASLESMFALFSPFLILWLPIADTFMLIIFRILRKRIPFSKSKDHIVFKMRSLGFSNLQILGFMFLLCLIFSAAGVIITRVNNQLAVVIIAGVIISTVLLFWKLRKIIIHE